MYRRVCAYIREKNMIGTGDQVIAGVSGGTDSMAMIFMLSEYQKEESFGLRVVHVHHGIRKGEADRDAALVEAFCKERGIPFQKYAYDVPALASMKKMGEEETGRMVRKEAFQKEAARLGFPEEKVRIALAHNQDDLAETFLHNLCRGAGLKGLSPMRPVEGRIIRPVLCLEKKEILNYLKEKEIPHMMDGTNLSDRYTRNRIRLHVMPLLREEVNPAVSSHIAQSAALLCQAADYLERQGRRLAGEMGEKLDNGWFFRDAFFLQDQALVFAGILEIFYEVSGVRKDFQMIHVEDLERLSARQVGKKICLPCNLLAERVYGGIRLSKGTAPFPFAPELGEKQWILQVPGEMDSPFGRVEAKIFSYQKQKIVEKKYTKWIDYDKIRCNLSVRTRRAGDVLTVNKEGNKKKLSRYFIDDKVPKELRDGIPLVADGAEIVWVIGGRLGEKYKINPDTKRVLELQYKGGSTNDQ